MYSVFEASPKWKGWIFLFLFPNIGNVCCNAVWNDALRDSYLSFFYHCCPLSGVKKLKQKTKKNPVCGMNSVWKITFENEAIGYNYKLLI